MNPTALRIWCNLNCTPPALETLRSGTTGHELIMADLSNRSVLAAGSTDSAVRDSDIAFGQPDPIDVIGSTRLRWVHLSSAGYTRYDRADLREAVHVRRVILTNSSSVYSEPCAQHVLSLMLAQSRGIFQAIAQQLGPRGWPHHEIRSRSRLTEGQTVLIVGYGAIGRRLSELLAPLRTRQIGLRRVPRGDESIPVHPLSEVDRFLPQGDHIVDLLPQAQQTRYFFDERRIGLMKPSAVFYNVGRGSTVEQDALVRALETGRLAGACLDVCEPEPLPAAHPLWTTPGCIVTPHTAGGDSREYERLVAHFLGNFRLLLREEPLRDQIM